MSRSPYRRLYWITLRLHPPRFRYRFGDEMMCIFDETPDRRARLDLLADGLLSLGRQRILRSQRAVASDAVALDQNAGPVKAVFVWRDFDDANRGLGSSRLVQGAFVSIAVFVALSWMLSYGGRRTARWIPALGTGQMSTYGRSAPTASVPSDTVGAPTSESLWSLMTSSLSKQSPHPAVPAAPDAQAAHQLDSLVGAFNTGDYNTIQKFLREHRAGTPFKQDLSPTPQAASQVVLFQKYGPYDLRRIEESKQGGVVVVAQSRSTNLWVRLHLQVADTPSQGVVYTARLMDTAPATAAPPPPPAAFAPSEAPWEKPFALPPSVLKSYAGVYRFSSPDHARIVVTYRKKQLWLKMPGHPATRVFAQSETRFFQKGVTDSWIDFVKANDGRVPSLLLHNAGTVTQADRKPAASTGTAPARRSLRYS